MVKWLCYNIQKYYVLMLLIVASNVLIYIFQLKHNYKVKNNQFSFILLHNNSLIYTCTSLLYLK